MKIITLSLFLSIFFFGSSQTYLHPTVGLNSTYSGGCPESTCSGTYYDDGGQFGNYSPNINQVYQTFCPDSPGTCLRALVNYDIHSGNFFNSQDWLRILDGPAQNSPLIAFLTNSGAGTWFANNSSGCLTFMFRSGPGVQRPGWTATFGCVACAARQPDGASDCLTGAIQVCDSSPLSGFPPGPGSVTEGCAGCAGAEGEIYSAWYYFEASTSGTLEFSIDPNDPTEDLDYALYGPNVDCGTLGTPIRCSYAISSGSTGLVNGAGGTSEDVFGSAWTEDISINAGDQYVLMVNNWSAGAGGYTINWGGTADLDCTPVNLPVQFLSFKGKDKPGFNEINWETATENNNDFFTVERSRDGSLWSPVATFKSKGNSSSTQSYQIEDREIEQGSLWYYRVKQTDFDGTTKTHDEIVAILNNYEKPHVVKVINLLGQEIDPNSTELRIEIYSDGSRVKKMGE